MTSQTVANLCAPMPPSDFRLVRIAFENHLFERLRKTRLSRALGTYFEVQNHQKSSKIVFFGVPKSGPDKGGAPEAIFDDFWSSLARFWDFFLLFFVRFSTLFLDLLCVLSAGFCVGKPISHHSIHFITKQLLKVAVKGAQQCEFLSPVFA